MGYRNYPDPAPQLIQYDPYWSVPANHLARLVDRAVETAIGVPDLKSGPGQPAFDLRLVLKVLVFGYATGIRSSRRLQAHCEESLAFLYLTRGDTPSYRTLCTARTHNDEALEKVWLTLFASAAEAGVKRLGRIKIDSSRFRANSSSESVVRSADYERLRAQLRAILAEAAAADASEDAEG